MQKAKYVLSAAAVLLLLPVSAPLLLLLPIGAKLEVKLRGSVIMAELSLYAAKTVRMLRVGGCAALDSSNGFIICSGKSFGKPVLAPRLNTDRQKLKKANAVLPRLLPAAAKSIRAESITASGCIGGADDPAAAALAHGALQTLFASLSAALPNARVSFCVRPEFGKKCVAVDLRCIALLRLGKFISISIKHKLFKKRSTK